MRFMRPLARSKRVRICVHALFSAQRGKPGFLPQNYRALFSEMIRMTEGKERKFAANALHFHLALGCIRAT